MLMTQILPFLVKRLSVLETSLNNEFDKLHNWLIANKLTLNANKAEYLDIGFYERLANC